MVIRLDFADPAAAGRFSARAARFFNTEVDGYDGLLSQVRIRLGSMYEASNEPHTQLELAMAFVDSSSREGMLAERMYLDERLVDATGATFAGAAR